MKKLYQLSDVEANKQLGDFVNGKIPNTVTRVIMKAFGKDIIAWFVDKDLNEIEEELTEVCNTYEIYTTETFTFRDRKSFNEPFIPQRYEQTK